MKKNPPTTPTSGVTTARRKFIARTRGRLAALFILLTAVALVVSTHSSATSSAPVPSGASLPSVSDDSSSLMTSPVAALFSKGEAERESERERERERAEKSKRASKRGRTGSASKSSDRRARSSKSSARGGRAAARSGKPGAKAQELQAAAPNIKQHKNELGQTVYEVSTTGFDVSPPLAELATLPSEEGTTNENELPFPSWRIPRSNQRDTVVQAVPTRNSRFANVPSLAAPTTGFNFEGVGGTGSFQIGRASCRERV